MKGRIAVVAGLSVVAAASTYVKPWEGWSNDPYLDIVRRLTVCVGHTGKDVQHRRYSDAECDQLLNKDMSIANAAVHRCIKRDDMPFSVEVALTAATFNIGQKVVCGSTLGDRANEGRWLEACAQLTDARNAKGEKEGWVYAGGKVVPQLIRRRRADRGLCERDLIQ